MNGLGTGHDVEDAGGIPRAVDGMHLGTGRPVIDELMEAEPVKNRVACAVFLQVRMIHRADPVILCILDGGELDEHAVIVGHDARDLEERGPGSHRAPARNRSGLVPGAQHGKTTGCRQQQKQGAAFTDFRVAHVFVHLVWLLHRTGSLSLIPRSSTSSQR